MNIRIIDHIEKMAENKNKSDKKEYQINETLFSFDLPYIMGILNVTPDSFSDGGKYFNKNDAVNHAIQMIDNGADIIDIGGESTRPGAVSVSEKEEMERVLPVIEEIKSKRDKVVISIDTSKSKVADESLKIGASIVNDVSGLMNDKRMVEIVSKHNAALVIMHMKGNPGTMQINPFYDDVIKEILEYLTIQSKLAVSFGIEKIIVDPGIGFGKRVTDNLEIISGLNEFKTIGYPLLIGVSRKSFLGKTLDLSVNNREEVTVYFELISMIKGANIIRTHNVKKAVQARSVFNFLENPELAVNV